MGIRFSNTKNIQQEDFILLYQANKWSAAKKPNKLYKALLNSDTLISAWDDKRLVGLGNAISDGHLVVYYPHLLILPKYQGKGIGKMIVKKMQEKYKNFHMQMLTADDKAVSFYQKVGFKKAGKTMSMWIYNGNEH